MRLLWDVHHRGNNDDNVVNYSAGNGRVTIWFSRENENSKYDFEENLDAIVHPILIRDLTQTAAFRLFALSYSLLWPWYIISYTPRNTKIFENKFYHGGSRNGSRRSVSDKIGNGCRRICRRRDIRVGNNVGNVCIYERKIILIL